MPRQRAGTAVLAALFFFTLSCDKGRSDLPLEPDYEDPQDASISGEVLIGEVGLRGVQITLSGPENRSLATDAGGVFFFGQLRRGSYSLHLWGFDPALHAFPITQQAVTVTAPDEVKVQFVGSLVPQPPAAPTGLQAQVGGPERVEVRWKDESDNESEFQVQRKEGGEGEWKKIGKTGADTASFSDRALTPKTTYGYRVRACNDVGCSDYSNEVAATTESAGGPNLFISDLYISQSTQTLGGDVPLVADKAGYLRVFVLAEEANDLQPDVRVSFYLGGGLAYSETIPAPGPSAPTDVYESSLGYSWNMAVPKSLIQPGLSVLAEVDPENEIPEGDETDNAFPGGGSPAAMAVASTPTFEVTFVPVRQSVNGLVGNVTSGNSASFLDVTREMLPIADTDRNIHAEYVTDALVLESDNANGAWGTVLSELYALRVTEGGSGHYYGVVKTPYTSGVAGMGYLGWPAAVGWDRLPSGSGVAAHELGHNWNRAHAPGCGVASPDPGYPYADGKIGVWGLDVGSEALKSPAIHYDFMSYCGPDWVSDYNYEAILDYRQAQGAWIGSGTAEPSLLVWGRVEGDRIVLEPAFRVATQATLPSPGGDYLMEGLGRDGVPLFSLAFEPVPVPDGLPGEGHFAFAIPLAHFDDARLAGLRVRGGGRPQGVWVSRSGAEAVAAAEAGLGLEMVGGSVVEMTWDPTKFPMALVRDPATGEVLSFARSGSVRLPLSSTEVEVVFSDGIRSSLPVRRAVR
jgi:hypothetical protein